MLSKCFTASGPVGAFVNLFTYVQYYEKVQ